MYGYGFDPATGTGGAGFTGVDTSAPYSSETGKAVPDPFGTSPSTNAKVTGGRRPKSRRGGVDQVPDAPPGGIQTGPVSDIQGVQDDTKGGRRKSKKGSKRRGKAKTARRTRKMRGGAWSPGNVNAGAVRAEFVGNTSGVGPFTYGTYVGAASKVPAPGGPVMGADGVMKA